jgi:hypothetical protein
MIYYKYKDSRNNFIVSEGRLSKEAKVLNAAEGSEEFFKKEGGTLCMYIRLQNGDKTVNINETHPTLLKVKGIMEVNVLNGGLGVELVIMTKNTKTSRSAREIIKLPPIPRQKWINFCILREGRRFDVLYNGKIVASKRLTYVPVYVSSPIIIGNPKLNGEFINGFVYGYRMNARDLKEEIESTSNTRGEPYAKNSSKELLSIFSFSPSFGCPGGKPCNSSVSTPLDPTIDFESEYA